MPYKEVPKGKTLAAWHVNDALSQSLNSLNKEYGQIEHIGLTGFLNKFPSASEHIRSFMEHPDEKDFRQLIDKEKKKDMPPGKTDISQLTPEELAAWVEKFGENASPIQEMRQDNEDRITERDKATFQLSDKSYATVRMLLDSAHNLMQYRSAIAYSATTPEEKQACKTPLPALSPEMLLMFAMKGASAEYIKSSVKDMGKLMRRINADTTVSDNIQRVCEAFYTMATADTPLTLEEAKAQVSKTTLIAPKRGGIEGKGA